MPSTLHSFADLHCGRGMSCKFGQYTIVNLYAPSGSNNRQARNIFFGADIVTPFARTVDDAIVASDFNCVLHDVDCIGPINTCGHCVPSRLVSTSKTLSLSSTNRRFTLSVQ